MWISWDAADSGDVDFATGTEEDYRDILGITWYPEAERSRFKDYSERARSVPVEIAGENVYVQFERRRFDDEGTVSFETALPPKDGSITTIHGGIRGDRTDAVALLESLESVDTATWLAAMPKKRRRSPAIRPLRPARILEG